MVLGICEFRENDYREGHNPHEGGSNYIYICTVELCYNFQTKNILVNPDNTG